LRITVIADPIVPVPPVGYGGTERVVHSLCEGLHQRGHEVTLLAAPGSHGPWKIVAHRPPDNSRYLSRAYRKILFQLLSLRHTAGRDLVISFGRLDYLWALLRSGRNVMQSFQNPISQSDAESIPLTAKAVLVSVSDAQRAHIKSGSWSTIYNAVPVAKMKFSIAPGNHLAFLGRLHPNKGAHIAIRIAQAANRPLVIAGNLPDDDAGRAYFEGEIKPHLGSAIRWIGEVGDEEKNEFLRRASALLFPIQWDEPFGLVMIEALACGTPVIAMRRGAVPEIVEHGVTGFISDDAEDMVRAVTRIPEIDRAKCRRAAEARFSEKTMIDAYLALSQTGPV
jgi:glycosyltransferase involved in cell wall biosynthesis